MHTGSCCCGEVKFEVARPPSMLAMCHCSRCRKLGVGALAFVKREDLTVTSGQESIGTYKPEAPFKYVRNFCAKCGTGLGEILSTEDSFPISAHLFDTPLDLEIKFHEWVDAKPAWYCIGDAAPQHDGHPS